MRWQKQMPLELFSIDCLMFYSIIIFGKVCWWSKHLGYTSDQIKPFYWLLKVMHYLIIHKGKVTMCNHLCIRVRKKMGIGKTPLGILYNMIELPKWSYKLRLKEVLSRKNETFVKKGRKQNQANYYCYVIN